MNSSGIFGIRILNKCIPKNILKSYSEGGTIEYRKMNETAPAFKVVTKEERG